MRSGLNEVRVAPLRPERLATVIGEERSRRLHDAADVVRALLAGRRVFNINSTATGGGVAEMLQTLLANARGLGIDARWLVIPGSPQFFETTKRIHNRLYGSPGDGGPLDVAERAVYDATLFESVDAILHVVEPGDVVLLHDPQTAGLAPALIHAGANVVWRCHVGIDVQNEWSTSAWDFLRPYLEQVEANVFTRRAFAAPWMDDDCVNVIPPSIDPFSAKNRDLPPEDVHAVLSHAGLIADAASKPVSFTRRDGSVADMTHYADVLQTGPAPAADTPLVVQISRWDRMKDMTGVMDGFVDHVGGTADAHVMLAGPNVSGVADDPEGGAVLDECMERWHRLPHDARARVHLACLPMHDPDENATIVNALQRHATVITQKSLAEGFGLTVVEAMWKARPVVATRVGGIAEQIVDGEHGLLVDDPHDLGAFGAAVRRVLEDPALGARLGAQARARTRQEFLGDTHLERWGELLIRQVDRGLAG